MEIKLVPMPINIKGVAEYLRHMDDEEQERYFNQVIGYPETKWELDKNAEYAIRFMFINGFSYKVKRQNYGSTVFAVSRDGIEEDWKIESNPEYDIKNIMKRFLENWEMSLKVRELMKN